MNVLSIVIKRINYCNVFLLLLLFERTEAHYSFVYYSQYAILIAGCRNLINFHKASERKCADLIGLSPTWLTIIFSLVFFFTHLFRILNFCFIFSFDIFEMEIKKKKSTDGNKWKLASLIAHNRIGAWLLVSWMFKAMFMMNNKIKLKTKIRSQWKFSQK